jgi:hypothetical protein
MNRALVTSPRWCSRAPLGNPVVPEVYWIWAGSPGRTVGSEPPSSWARTVDGQSAKGNVTRRSGSCRVASRAIAVMSLPRNAATWNRPAERDCSST